MVRPQISGGNAVLNLNDMTLTSLVNNIPSSSFSAPLLPIHDSYTLRLRRRPKIGVPTDPCSVRSLAVLYSFDDMTAVR